MSSIPFFSRKLCGVFYLRQTAKYAIQPSDLSTEAVKERTEGKGEVSA
jgi:hypothetical protein